MVTSNEGFAILHFSFALCSNNKTEKFKWKTVNRNSSAGKKRQQRVVSKETYWQQQPKN